LLQWGQRVLFDELGEGEAFKIDVAGPATFPSVRGVVSCLKKPAFDCVIASKGFPVTAIETCPVWADILLPRNVFLLDFLPSFDSGPVGLGGLWKKEGSIIIVPSRCHSEVL
jgi:hypothetical protein